MAERVAVTSSVAMLVFMALLMSCHFPRGGGTKCLSDGIELPIVTNVFFHSALPTYVLLVRLDSTGGMSSLAGRLTRDGLRSGASDRMDRFGNYSLCVIADRKALFRSLWSIVEPCSELGYFDFMLRARPQDSGDIVNLRLYAHRVEGMRNEPAVLFVELRATVLSARESKTGEAKIADLVEVCRRQGQVRVVLAVDENVAVEHLVNVLNALAGNAIVCGVMPLADFRGLGVRQVFTISFADKPGQ